MSKEIIEEIIDLLEENVGQYHDDKDRIFALVRWEKYIKALTLLKQQPPAGEFTKKNREYFTVLPEELCDSLIQKAVRKCCLVIQEACDIIDRAESLNADLLEACNNSPAPNYFSTFADFAEECTEKASMAIYKGKFITLATFLRSCENRAITMQAAIAKAKSEVKE